MSPDDTTPIPRFSTCYGREHFHDIHEENAQLIQQAARGAAQQPSSIPERPSAHSGPAPATAALATASAPAAVEQSPSLLPPEARGERIDKSLLPRGEPKRIRDKEHLKFVARQPCIVCGRQPADAHHLRFAQPRALGMKVSDEFTVPLCRTHHRNLHQTGNETGWWEKARIEPLPIARKLWETSHPRAASRSRIAPAEKSEAETAAADQTKPIAAVQP